MWTFRKHIFIIQIWLKISYIKNSKKSEKYSRNSKNRNSTQQMNEYKNNSQIRKWTLPVERSSDSLVIWETQTKYFDILAFYPRDWQEPKHLITSFFGTSGNVSTWIYYEWCYIVVHPLWRAVCPVGLAGVRERGGEKMQATIIEHQ